MSSRNKLKEDEIELKQEIEVKKQEEDSASNKAENSANGKKSIEKRSTCYYCWKYAAGMTKCFLCGREVCKACTDKQKVFELSKQWVLSIPDTAFSGNKYEQRIMQDYLNKSNLTVVKLTKEMLDKVEAGEFKFSNRHLKQTDIVCYKCFVNTWNDLMYKYRVTISGKLPLSVTKRPDCWYGRECTTQSHNNEHARKFNHICENTKKPNY
eukprot:TRINITY_DN22894_c0_g1_i1.p1 TRINITY_DN22894_c0_g1~~TRINITY_DN22894_c0_g1_i1.p1  ORF type:complete len:210 (+),score=43.94 TRINITY_DN22894_c0_g1_i1:434-1063(+)